MFKNAVFSLLVIVSVIVDESEQFLLQKRGDIYMLEEKMAKFMDPKKRPFCNAFTGCGRKRSNFPALTSKSEELEESISTLLELNAEPAVENLSRQIMSEAKLSEAIQEANAILKKCRQKANLLNNNANSVVEN